MAQQAVETILIRQLAGYLSVPVMVADPEGAVVYYNEPAERLLGVRYEETGRLTQEQFAGHFESRPLDGEGEEAERPLGVALEQRRPVHSRLELTRRADGALLKVDVTAFPIIGQGDVVHGAVVMFWEQSS